MNPQRKYKSLIFLLFAALILSACQPGPSDEEEIAVIVAAESETWPSVL